MEQQSERREATRRVKQTFRGECESFLLVFVFPYQKIS